MSRRAFTLVELLVVIGILSMLIALLLPSLYRAKCLAKEAVCATDLYHAGRAVAVYMKECNVRTPWIFANGSGDHPHEGNSSEKSPGNPAKILVPDYINARTLFCPCSPVTYDKHYTQSPSTRNKGYWGTYCWRYRKVKQAEDPYYRNGHGNDITYTNDLSKEVVMTDTASSWWERRGFPPTWLHYNVMMLDSHVELVTRDDLEFLHWMWGPPGKPYGRWN